MMIYPTMEIQNGRCVSLEKGRLDEPLIWHVDPVETAKGFAAAGAEWMHITDFNAIEGDYRNEELVLKIIRAAGIPVQLGGGIRDMATIERWIGKGLARVILGTVAVENPDLVREAAREFPGKVAVGIDARNGKVATKGWAEETDVMVTDLAKSFEDAGVAAIIYTDILRDGAMKGPNVEATADLANAVSIPVIASGGVSSLDDLRALKSCGAPLNGAISGRALYDGAIDLKQALATLKA